LTGLLDGREKAENSTKLLDGRCVDRTAGWNGAGQGFGIGESKLRTHRGYWMGESWTALLNRRKLAENLMQMLDRDSWTTGLLDGREPAEDSTKLLDWMSWAGLLDGREQADHSMELLDGRELDRADGLKRTG
jgi:hypothetical protein